MSSTPNVTISLNPTGSKPNQSSPKADDAADSGGQTQQSPFSDLVDQVRHSEATEAGNPLPKEAGVIESNPNQASKTIDINLEDLVVRREGRLKLITGEIPVSEESLVEFMREQGFSRAEMAEILMARQDPSTVVTGEQPLLTGDWLQMQAVNRALSESSATAKADAIQPSDTGQRKMQPMNLAEALAQQVITPKTPNKTSPIVDVVITRDMLTRLVVTDEVKSDANLNAPVKTLDLNSLLARVDPAQSGMGGQTAGQETGQGFERGERLMTEPANGAQKPQEFREFLAEHLRRADSLKELSDRLGTMLARQMNAHIARGTWRLEMALHPAELGSIEVDMEMTERGLEASFRATQSVTRDLLMESMARLKSWFEEGGIDVAYAGLTQDSGAQTGGNPTSEQSSGQPDTDEVGEAVDTELSGGGENDPHRLDIRV